MTNFFIPQFKMKVGWCLLATLLLATGGKGFINMKISSRALDNDDLLVPDDRQITVQIPEGQTKFYLYLLQQDVEWLSITVTPCSAPISWDVSFRPCNQTGKVDMPSNAMSGMLETEPRSYEEQFAQQGLYTLRISSPKGDGTAQIFATTLSSLKRLRPTAKLSVTNKRQKGQISVRWPTSPIDVKYMLYWLVVSPTQSFPSLCKAKVEESMLKTRAENSIFLKNNELMSSNTDDFIIEHTGKKTNAVIKGLKLNQGYFIELFAFNNATKMSYLYSNSTFKYQRTRPIPLRDGRPSSANIKRMDGRVTFRYKVRASETSKKIEWYVLACGPGAIVDAEIRQKRKPVLGRTRIFGYGRMVLEDPIPGYTYILRINSTDPEILDRINTVQVLGTMRGLKEPTMPIITNIYEDKMARGCRSVTLKWLAATGSEIEYCAIVKEVYKNQEYMPFPDQCGQEKILRNYDYTTSQCFSDVDPNLSTIVQEIKYLKKGKTYDIQMTVRSGRSKILSYQNIRVRTKPTCH